MMKGFAISITQWAAVFVCVIASSNVVEAQQPVAANRAKNLQNKSKEAVDAKGKNVPTHASVEQYLRTLIGKERKAHAKEIAASKKKVQMHAAIEQYLRTVIGKEREAHAKEIAALKKQLRKPDGNLKPNAKRSRVKSPF